MREVIQPPPVINVYDDISLHRDKARVLAAETVIVAFQGKTVELDVSVEHYSEIAEFMRPLMEAGRKVGDKAPAHATGERKAIIDYRKALREWVRQCDLKNRAGNGWAYETDTGSHHTYYPVWLLEKYDAYLATAAVKG